MFSMLQDVPAALLAQPLREPSALDEPRSFRLLFYAGSALGQGRHFAGIDDICGEA